MGRIFFLTCKRSIPYIGKLVIAGVLIGLLALGGLFGMRESTKDVPEANKTTVGIVVDPAMEHRLLMMSLLLDYTSDIMHLEQFKTEAEGMEALGRGAFRILVVVPTTAIADLRTGKNTPIEIRSRGTLGLDEILIREMIEAGTRELSSTQAGIYAASRLLRQTFLGTSVPEALSESARAMWESVDREVNETLNNRYLAFATSNRSFFRSDSESQSAEGAGEIATGMLLLTIALLFIVFYSMVARDSAVLWKMLRIKGLPFGVEMLSKFAAVFLTMSIAVFLVTLLFWLLGPTVLSIVGVELEALRRLDIVEKLVMGMRLWLSLLPAVAFFAGIWILTTTLIQGVYAAFAYIAIAVALLFLAGYILPLDFLPYWLRQIGQFVPVMTPLGIACGVGFSLVAQAAADRRFL